jgi:dolichyl-phosphate-mannose--protein O-mannosyl transferase
MFRLDGNSVPRWFDVTRGLTGDTVSTITVFGNPAVWWVGFIAMIALAFYAFKVPQLITSLQEKTSIKAVLHGWDKSALFIVVVFAFAWLPYIFIGRAAYIYHFYSAVPMLCLALAFFINKFWSRIAIGR